MGQSSFPREGSPQRSIRFIPARNYQKYLLSHIPPVRQSPTMHLCPVNIPHISHIPQIMRNNPQRPPIIRTLYLIGDDGCDKSSIFQLLELQQEELNHEINVYVKVLPAMSPLNIPSSPAQATIQGIELYDFPTDRIVRSAMSLYLKLLPSAGSVLYFMKDGASEKDICEWIRVLHDCQVASRVIFVSDVSTYLQREKILTRLAREFSPVLDITFFVKLEPYALRRSFSIIQQCGVTIEGANCLKPTFSRKIMNVFQKIIRVIKKKRVKLSSQSKSESVV